MMDLLTLLVLTLLATQGVIFLVGGIVQIRQRRPGGPAIGRAQQETPMRGISGRSRIGMGVGILAAVGVTLATLSLLSNLLPPGPLPPPELLGITLTLLLFALGMVVGSGLGLAVGAPGVGNEPAVESAPTGLRPKTCLRRLGRGCCPAGVCATIAGSGWRCCRARCCWGMWS